MIKLKGKLRDYALSKGYYTEFQIPESARMYPDKKGNMLPSVTSVLGILPTPQGIIEWQKRLGIAATKRISREAMLRGTELHKYAENYFAGTNKRVIQDRLCKIMIKGFLDWALENKKKMRTIELDGKKMTEFKFRGSPMGYAGTVDHPIFFKIAEGVEIIRLADYKTSSSATFYPEAKHKYSLQLCAYIGLFNELMKKLGRGKEWYAREAWILNFTYSRKSGQGEHILIKEYEIKKFYLEFKFYLLIFQKIYGRYRSKITISKN